MTGEALGHLPPATAIRAAAAGLEGVPGTAAEAGPEVPGTRPPAAARAADAALAGAQAVVRAAVDAGAVAHRRQPAAAARFAAGRGGRWGRWGRGGGRHVEQSLYDPSDPHRKRPPGAGRSGWRRAPASPRARRSCGLPRMRRRPPGNEFPRYRLPSCGRGGRFAPRALAPQERNRRSRRDACGPSVSHRGGLVRSNVDLKLGAQASRLLLVPQGRKSIDREFIPWIPDQRPCPWGSGEPTAELANFGGKAPGTSGW